MMVSASMPDSSSKLSKLANVLAGSKLPEVLLDGPLSVRLRSVIKTPHLLAMNLLHYLQEKDSTLSYLLQARNCGAGTVAEFKKKCDAIVKRELLAQGVGEKEIFSTIKDLKSHKTIGSVAEIRPVQSTSQQGGLINSELFQLDLLQYLRNRDQALIRLGLLPGGDPQMTSEIEKIIDSVVKRELSNAGVGYGDMVSVIRQLSTDDGEIEADREPLNETDSLIESLPGLGEVEGLLESLVLPDAVLEECSSVRLHNILVNTKCPASDLLYFLRNRELVLGALSNIRNCGISTVNEFERSCDAVIAEQLSDAGVSNPCDVINALLRSRDPHFSRRRDDGEQAVGISLLESALRNSHVPDVILGRELSVRLRNVLSKSKCPTPHLLHFLRSRKTVLEDLSNIRNCGATTVAEFNKTCDEMIKEALLAEGVPVQDLETATSALSEKYNSLGPARYHLKELEELLATCRLPEILFDEPSAIRVRHALQGVPRESAVEEILVRDVLSSCRLPDALLEEDITVRLKNVIQTPSMVASNLFVYLQQKQEVLRRLVCAKNCGETTGIEFERSCDSLVRQRLKSVGVKDEYLNYVVNALSRPGAYFTHAYDFIGDVEDVTEEETISELLEEYFELLTERQTQVIHHRFGFSELPRTLEEVGEILGVTREAVRQIERKALDKRGVRKLGGRLRRALSNDFEKVWNRLGAGSSFIVHLKPTKELSFELALAFKVAKTNPKDWLDSNARVFGRGWHKPFAGDFNFEDLLEQAEGIITDLALPRPIAGLLPDVPKAVLEALLGLSGDFSCYAGYVFVGHLGSRAKRTVRLHQILAEMSTPTRIDLLVNRYWELFPDDKCAVRDAEGVMGEAPHLFSEVYEQLWLGIGEPSGEEMPARIGDQVFSQGAGGGVKFPIGRKGVADKVEELLSAEGPLPMAEIIANVAGRSRGEIPKSSVQAILVVSGRFIRVLPGIYATLAQATTEQLDCQHLLQTEKQCRYYTMAMKVSEEKTSYPAWETANEFELCRWAQANAPGRTFESLMDVVKPGKWAITADLLNHWRTVKEQHSNYLFYAGKRYRLEEFCPKPRMVFSAIAFIAEKGRFSWISANRVIKKRFNSHRSASLLAVLIAIGALEPADHWQKEHMGGDKVGELKAELENELFRTGCLSWREGALSTLLSQALTSFPNYSKTWLGACAHELGSLLDCLKDNSHAAHVGVEQSVGAFERFLEQRRLDSFREGFDG